MNVAILTAGEPRFCLEFDRLLENLIEFDSIDWYIHSWNHNPLRVVKGQKHTLVSPKWESVDRDQFIEQFTSNLPAGHSLENLTLEDQSVVDMPFIKNNVCQGADVPSIWKMWYGPYMANQARKASNKHYDIVIRTRPDIGLKSPLNLREAKQVIDSNPTVVWMPANRQCGYGVSINDMFGMSSPANMDVYTDLYNQALDHHAAGCIYHPETMLAHHLNANGLIYSSAPVEIYMRNLGKWVHPDTGTPVSENQGIYISNFGRWE
jgi:hypothetical protein